MSRWFLDFHNRTVLFRVGDWVVTTYAFLAGVAFGTGFAVALWYDSMLGMDVEYIAKLYLFLVVPALLICMRAFSMMLEWRELFRRPLATLIKPGYMYHGGIVGCMASIYVVSDLSGVPFLRLMDAPAFAMPLGEAIARLGCFVYGCCWGRPTRSALGDRFGIRYTSRESKVLRAAPHLENIKIHPAQIYALVAYLALFVVFYIGLPYLPFDGALAGIYIISHSVIRYALEHFRQDDRGQLWGKFTHTNLYSALMIVGGIVCLVYGNAYSEHVAANLDISITHVLGNGSILPWLVLYGVVFGFAYGVHYKKVGSWISAPDRGTGATVEEDAP